MTRTVVKANYVALGGASGGAGRQRLEASASYYGHRPDERGERRWRPAFAADREGMSKEEARGFVGGAEGGYGYRMVLSPGREMDADGLREWTRELMSSIESDRGTWVGWVHDDHTDNPHAHVLAFVEERFDVEDFEFMRERGDEAVALYMAWVEEVERDPLLDEDYALEQARWLRGNVEPGEIHYEAYAYEAGPRERGGEAPEHDEGGEPSQGNGKSTYESWALGYQFEIFEVEEGP